MANSFLKKTMVYLGLLDEEYDEYDEYDERAPRGYAGQANFEPEPEPDAPPERTAAAPPFSRIRPLSRDQVVGSTATMGGRTITSTPSVRPMSPGDAAKVQVVAPTRFGDAKEIADCLKSNRPVIVNLQMADRDLQRRMIDFCSGVTYALSGDMEKVADQVFLLAPTNVKVSEEERQRLQERGFSDVIEAVVIRDILVFIIEAYVVVLIARALLSWFPARPGTTLYRVVQGLDTVTEPVLRPIRRLLPPVGLGGTSIDLSIMIVVIVAQVIVLPLIRS